MSINAVINVVVVALLVWFVYSKFRPVNNLKTLTADEFRQAMKASQIRVIDVREADEYKSGYIAGAVNVPLSQLQGRLDELSPDKTLLLYCRSGMRSKKAAAILSKKGYAQLVHLQGGISAWNGKLTH